MTRLLRNLYSQAVCDFQTENIAHESISAKTSTCFNLFRVSGMLFGGGLRVKD